MGFLCTSTLEYNANGGTGAPANTVVQTQDPGPGGGIDYVDVRVDYGEPTRSGYTFKNWKYTQYDVTKYVVGGDEVTFQYNFVGSDQYKTITLYAQWQTDTYTVSFDANGGTGAPAAQTKTHGTNLTLSSTVPTRTGYTFVGWNTKSDGSGVGYSPGGTYSANAGVILYAIWARLTYTITFNANEGENAPAAQTKTYGIDLTLTDSEPTREGYAFVGWATSNTAVSADYQPGDTYSAEGNATLYAVWQLVIETHTLTYDANGGTGAPASETQTYSVLSPTSFTVSSTQPTKTGHTFSGWSSTASGSVEYAAGDSIPASADKTLYAVWQINTYQVSFNANGGTGAPAAQTKTYGVDLTLSSTIPTRTGYNFLGWAESSSATVAAYAAGGTYTKNQAKTLYAVWQLKTYTVSYNANGGTGAPANQTKTHGQTLKLSSQTPTKAGSRFQGWGLAADATAIAYEAGDDYTNNAAITLYAVWVDSESSGVYVMHNGELVPAIVYL